MLDRRIRSAALTECGEINQRKSKMLNRALRSNARYVLFLVLALSIAVLVLVLEAVWYSNPAHWSASCRDGIGQRLASPRFEEPSSTSTSTVALSTSTTKSNAMCDRRIRSAALTECGEINQRKSKMLNRALRSNARYVLFLVLALSIAVLVLVLEAVWYSNPAHWSASCRDGIGQRLASPRFEEPSSTSTSTVALSTSTTKSNAMLDRRIRSV